MVFQRIDDDHDRDCDENDDENDDEQGHAMKDDHHHQLRPYPLPPISTVTDAAAWTTSTNTSTGTISNSSSNSTSSSSSSLPFYHRPRVLYGTVFIWLSIAGGRFLAPLLQHEGSFQSSSSSSSSNTSTSGDGGNGGTFDIGLILAIQQLVGIPCNTYASHITDLYVQRYQNPHLRAIILLGGCFVANMSFLLMGVRHLYETDDVDGNHTDGFQHHVMYYMILRIIFAISLSFVLPVLDGLCVHHISNVPTTTFTTLKTTTATNGSDRHNQSESSNNKNSYGKERLWGAITWAVTNVVIGPLYDHYGFEISYLASIGAFLLVSLSVYLYIQQPLPAVSIDTKFVSSSPTKTKRTKSGAYTELETSTRGVDRDDDDDDEPTISMDDDDDNDRTTNVERTDSVVYSKIELLQCLLFSSPDHHRHDQSSRSTGRTSHNDGENVDSVPPTWIPPPTSPRVYYFGSVFILSIIILSFGRIIVESLIFLYFEELGSSYFIMGCTVVLTVLFEIPVFSISSALLQYFGTSALLRIAMICYIVRVIGYSFIPNGHVQYAFILEPLHGVTYACSQTAVVDFVHHRTPPGYESTGQSFVYLFRGLGSVLGLIIGGYMTDVIGARMVYRIAAMIVSIGCLSLSAVQSQPSPPATLESSTQRRATDNQDERRRCPESMTDDESIEMVRSIT